MIIIFNNIIGKPIMIFCRAVLTYDDSSIVLNSTGVCYDEFLGKFTGMLFKSLNGFLLAAACSYCVDSC